MVQDRVYPGFRIREEGLRDECDPEGWRNLLKSHPARKRQESQGQNLQLQTLRESILLTTLVKSHRLKTLSNCLYTGQQDAHTVKSRPIVLRFTEEKANPGCQFQDFSGVLRLTEWRGPCNHL